MSIRIYALKKIWNDKNNIHIYIYKMGIDIIKQGWNSSNERIFLNAKFFINIIKIKRFHIKS